MSPWARWRPEARPLPPLPAWLANWRNEQALLPPFARTAPHIKGRVFKEGRQWHYEVINTRSGEVLVSDDCRVFSLLIGDAFEAVAVARGAWFFDLRRKALS